MKNFRKVLALILAVATLFSFVAMASAKTSADYSDSAKIEYTEAVDVLSAVGILKGYNGAYHPSDNVGRDEMAKMIAVLRNGAVDNSALFTGANTFADCKGSWAEGYIAYCAQVGIINGRNATTFDPEGNVTGTEVMKMLLCVLGYDAKLQGYTGSNWQVNVLRDANKMGLLDGLAENYDPYKAATRDEAAQLMLNALEADMVYGYVSDNIVKITNSLYLKDPKDNVSTNDAKKDGWEFAYCNAVISKTPLWSIIDGLTWSAEGKYDCFGRPGHKWVYKVDKKEVFSCFYKDAYKKMTTSGSLDDDFIDDYEINEFYVDGYEVEKASEIKTGNGVLIEYYEDRIVVINTYIAKVGTISKYKDTFTLVNDDDEVLAKFDVNDYEIEEDDVVLFHLCNGSVEGDDANTDYNDDDVVLHDLTVVTPTEVTVSEGVNKKDQNDSYLVASDKTYKYAALLGWVLDADDNMDCMIWDDIDKDGKDWDLYLDEYGYIKYYEPHDDGTDYTYTYIVEGTLAVKTNGYHYDKDGEWTEDWDRTATLVNYGKDGTLTPDKDVAVDENVEDAVLDNHDKETGKGKKGIGVLAKVFTNDDDLVEVKAVAEYAKAGTELDKDSFELLDEDIYATSKTVFMIRTKNTDGTYSYEQVTGYKNLKGSYVAVNTEDGETNIQFFRDEDHKAYASYVFIDAVYTRDNDITFFTLGNLEFGSFQTKYEELYADDFFAYKALVKGEEAIVLVSRKYTSGDSHELAFATKYEATLSYIGVSITNEEGCKDLPIYSVVDGDFEEIKDFSVACYYEVDKDAGEAYVRFTEDVRDAEGTLIAKGGKKVYKVADDATVATLTAVQDEDDNWEVAVKYTILTADEAEADEVIFDHAYLTINDDDEITEFVVVDATLYNAIADAG